MNIIDTLLGLIEDFVSSGNYSVVVTVLIIICIIYFAYSKIRYNVLNKACQFIAEVESNASLTGEQKFNLVKVHIVAELTLPNTNIINKLMDKLVQYAFDNSKSFALNYISRKTNIDKNEISKLLDVIKKENINKE